MPLHEIFEQQAKTNPNSIALCFEDQPPITYNELNARANQLARYLMDKGINFQNRVVVRVKRSVEQVIALLAIQKIGAIYIPISPPDPTCKIDAIDNILGILEEIEPICLIGDFDSIKN